MQIDFRLIPSGITTSHLNDKDISTSSLFAMLAHLLATSELLSRRCSIRVRASELGGIVFTFVLSGEGESDLGAAFLELSEKLKDE